MIRTTCWSFILSYHPYHFVLSAKNASLSLFVYYFTELFVHCYCSSKGHWWATRYVGDRVICGGCAWWKYQGWNMLLCWGPDQVQPEVTGWCVRAFGCARPDRTHWQNVSMWGLIPGVENVGGNVRFSLPKNGEFGIQEAKSLFFSLHFCSISLHYLDIFRL